MPTSDSDAAYEVVRLASRAVLSDERARRLREAAERVESWKDVLGVGAYHRALPLLYGHVREWAPDDVVAALRDYAQRRAVDVLFLTSEMARIARAFTEAGVPFLTFKGPSLAEAYGGTARRPFVDNDLLIAPGDYQAAHGVLSGIGFGKKEDRSHLQQLGYLRIYGEDTFTRTVGPLLSAVDLHTRLVPVGYPYHGPFDALYSRSRTLSLTGVDVPTFSWGDLFLALAVNALKDQWNRLRLATDLAETAPFVLDWAALLERAQRTRCLRALHVGVLVAEEAVGGEFPEPVSASARRDARAIRLARGVVDRFPTAHAEPVMSGAARMRFTLRTPDGPRGQAQYLAYVGLRRVLEPVVAGDKEE